MRKKGILFVVTTGFLVCLLLFFLKDPYSIFNNKGYNITTDSGFYLGTVISIKIFDEQETNQMILNKAFDLIDTIENKLSKNIENSEISKVNRNAGEKPIQVSEGTFKVVSRGIYYSQISNGLFDITVAPLVDLWGIGSESARIPSQQEIIQVLELIDYNKLSLSDEDCSIMLQSKNMAVDLGGIAKGYAADQIVDYLKDEGINHAVINLGGNICVLNDKPDGSLWRIGIQNPFNKRGTHVGIVKIKDKTVVTSGIYERYLEVDGERYHHILNPFTGYPVNNSLASISIVSDSSIDADALSTVVFSMGLDKGSQLVESMDNVEAVFITKHKEIYLTTGIKDKFELTEKYFTLKKISEK